MAFYFKTLKFVTRRNTPNGSPETHSRSFCSNNHHVNLTFNSVFWRTASYNSVANIDCKAGSECVFDAGNGEFSAHLNESSISITPHDENWSLEVLSPYTSIQKNEQNWVIHFSESQDEITIKLTSHEGATKTLNFSK